MRLSICLNPKSYLPEAYAYTDYLRGLGWTVQYDTAEAMDPNADMHLHFLGLLPFWKSGTDKVVQVHEYLSLSTGRCSKLKDFAKRAINKKPDGRLFLNPRVRNDFGFTDKVPSLLRDMGVEKSLFLPEPIKPEFDLVYCGSLCRAGLAEVVRDLSLMGLKILLVGSVPDDFHAKFKSNPLVQFTGRVSREHLPSLYQQALAGLNFTPDIYPFDIQTSTKVIEYCAAGLGIVSNRYEWVETFAGQRRANFLWLDGLRKAQDFHTFDFKPVNVDDLEWGLLLEKCRFESFLLSLLEVR